QAPTDDVTIAIASSDTTEGTTDVSSLVFNTSNWSTAQTVTVTGVQDFINDGNQAYSIITGNAASNDLAYDGFDVADVSVTNNQVANQAPVNSVPGAQTINED